MQTQEADGWSLRCLIIQKGVGKRMVMDRQKGQNQIRVQEVQSGRQARGQGRQKWSGRRVQKQARVKTGRTGKGRIAKAGEREKPLVDLEHTRQTGTERQETKG
jgi:hypothetical protein